MNDILPANEYLAMEDPADFTISIANVQLGVLSDDERSLAALGRFS